MNNDQIIWKWNPETEEWELPNFPKKEIDKDEVSGIIEKEDGDKNE